MSRARTADPAATEVIQVGDGAGGGPVHSPKGHRRPTKKKVFLIVGLVLVVLLGGVTLAGGLYLKSVEGDIERVDAFEDVPEAARPQKEAAAKGALNFLVLGSDSRDPENGAGSRTDTIILVHLDKNRSSAQLVSIPRDTWVHVPRSKQGRGGTDAKINAAFAWGGVPLMVQTVEEFTKVRIDHVAMVDFAGFKEIVDALGGVEIDVEEGFTSTHSLNPDGKRTFAKGRQTMDGAAALDYARERYALKDGDFGRIRHQQQVIKAIIDKAASGGFLGSPAKMNSFLRSTADAVSLDETLNIFTMAPDLRHLRGEDLTFHTSPTKGTGRVGDQSVVLPDTAKAKEFFDAIRRDAVSELPAPKK
ncbi:LCP family protein [Spirilliplanes yamanashiensis]|uniref:Transcriptional regulator n=1 Tax=Spirilliplanes yamanashiensis TaxID=42233 RepID=A0A8J3Y6H0_9ACTN|nr:LCP family protein [Spirilliplanes yamanashiensis]MDP9814750.1 LCP family protein required for cell wall assembly [Spirilliplanes yamanashiensis]GIJ02404.1 transcriptional regulator [Spirilliplanes yamanashiensis]